MLSRRSLLCIATLFGACGRTPAATPDAPVVEAAPSSQRSAEDIERDRHSRPEQVVPLLRLQPGARVLDFLTGGGYYAEVLAAEVGARGSVLAHNNFAYRKWVGPQIDERFEGRGLAQVEIYDRELDDLGLEPASLDAILLVNSYHDLYFVDAENDWPAVDAHAVMDHLVAALRPGGRLVVVDHQAAEGTGPSAAQGLHRIDRAFAIEDWSARGLELVDSTELAGTDDDRTKSVFDPSVRGKTERFVLAFER